MRPAPTGIDLREAGALQKRGLNFRRAKTGQDLAVAQRQLPYPELKEQPQIQQGLALPKMPRVLQRHYTEHQFPAAWPTIKNIPAAGGFRLA
jgi:hypothetical protein